MKRQIRPYVVEVKPKRNSQKRGNSIWGDVDLASIAAEAEAMDLAKPQLLDSISTPVFSVPKSEPHVELEMPPTKETDEVQIANEVPTIAEAPTVKKTSRSKTAQSPSKRAAKAEAAAEVEAMAQPASARPGRKVYSPKERAEKLGQIEKAINGGESMKVATKHAGIPMQTYYQWKKAAAPKPAESGELKDLLALEEENKRLKKLLAERLRKENAELRKKLGLQ